MIDFQNKKKDSYNVGNYLNFEIQGVSIVPKISHFSEYLQYPEIILMFTHIFFPSSILPHSFRGE